MIKQALKEHPTSGEAHYVAAEVYAREGNLGEARQELATAADDRAGASVREARLCGGAATRALTRAAGCGRLR